MQIDYHRFFGGPITSIEGYVVRGMTRSEVDLTISWANSEGWNPGIRDAETFYMTDPKGFLVGIFEGKPVASISAVAYGDSFGFLGFYIVQPSLRGRGLGREVWNGFANKVLSFSQ